MPRRIDLGRAVLFAGSALLFISLFLDWYDPGLSAWDVFEALDLVLAALAVTGMVAALRPDLMPPWAGVAVPFAALLIVFVQLVNDPPAAVGAPLGSGAWLALAGALLMAAGAALSLAAISVTVQVRERDVRRRVAAVDRRGVSDEDLAEDLDAEADLDAPSARPRRTSLFGGPHLDRDVDIDGDDLPDDDLGADAPPRRGGGFIARDPEAKPAAGPAPLERTQPMSALPDDSEGDAERP
jgi:hypothetical protein